MSNFDGVLFDFGYTLFTNTPAALCAAEFEAETGRELDAAAFDSTWAAVVERSRQPEELAKGRDLNEELHRQCWMELLAPLDDLAPGLAGFTYERLCSARGWEPYPDAAPVLVELHRRRVPVGVVSDCGWDIREVFKAYGLDEFVHSFDLSYEHGVCKPAPEMFLSACAHLGVLPGRALMVGDTPLTDGGAAAVGLLTLIVPARDRALGPALSHVLELVG